MVHNQPKPSDKYRKSRRWVDKEQGLYGAYFQLEDEIFVQSYNRWLLRLAGFVCACSGKGFGKDHHPVRIIGFTARTPIIPKSAPTGMGKRDNTPVTILPKCDVYAACVFLWWRRATQWLIF